MAWPRRRAHRRAHHQSPRFARCGADPPGRIDLALEIGLAGPQQVRALFLRFHPEAAAIADELAAALGATAVPASVQQVLLAHADAREAAVALRTLGAA